MGGKIWTQDEVAKLKEAYLTLNSQELLKAFPNRSHGSIRNKAKSLGIKRPNELRTSPKWFQGGVILEHLTEAEKGYLAGLIDGDGCITFTRNKRGICKIHIIITNTDKKMLNWVAWLLNKPKIYTYESQNKKNKPRHSWIATGRFAVQFLKEISPYLLLKRPLAERLSNGYVHLNQQERKDLEQFVRNFNKKGV